MTQSIDFRRKISTERPFSKNNCKLKASLESDRGRLINSAAIRRLQQKTQVFPLEKNAAVRSRLAHSLEVQQIGRYIAKTIFNKLSAKEQQKYGLDTFEDCIITLVEMGCLMHDIGNPPFGHFGEKAINKWFIDNINTIQPDILKSSDPKLKTSLFQDIINFEGNAQAIRLITVLSSLNLTYFQTACIMKYVKPAYSLEKNDSYLHKKPGYYWSEKDFISDLYIALNMDPDTRHPFVYIVEAADDISYCLADIEDAVEKGIISIEKLTEEFKLIFKNKLFYLNKKKMNNH